MSDQDASLFTQSTEGATSTPAQQETFGDLLKGITNETGEQKYSDVPKALEALAHSQTYIPELHTKLDQAATRVAELEAKLAKQAGIDEVVEKLQATRQEQTEQPPAGLDAEQAAQIFETMYTQSQQRELRAKNTKDVIGTMTEKFGDKAEEVFYAKGAELGLSRDKLNDLAGTSPAAVKALFGEAPAAVTSPEVTTSKTLMEAMPQQEEVRLGRNSGDSVLSGATSQDVRNESNYVKELVGKLHEEGVEMRDLADPKAYSKFFS